MTRIHLFSDLHSDHAGGDIGVEPVECDLAVFAGDLCNGLHKHLPDLLERFRGVPLVISEGNHDAYRQGSPTERAYTIHDVRARAQDICAQYGAHYVNDGYVMIGDVQVIASCLWSDFSVRPDYMSRREAMFLSQKGHHPDQPVSPSARRPHNDYAAIHTAAGKRLTPSETLAWHQASVEAIELALQAEPDAETTIVATHFPPAAHAVERLDLHTWLYASTDCHHLLSGPSAPDVWLHGHIHSPFDEVVGDTRVVSNPRGYPSFTSRTGFENAYWNPALVIDVEPKPRNICGMK